MKNLVSLLLLITIPLLANAGDRKESKQRFNGANIIYIDVNIDQPNIDDCYDETNLPEADVEKWLNVYPNPNQGVFYLEVQQLSFGENIEVSVLNTTGDNVYQKDVKTDGDYYQIKINLTYLPKGVYLIHVRAARGINVQRLIIL